MKLLADIAVKLIGFLFLLFAAKNSGKNQANKEMSEKSNEIQKKQIEISSRPAVSFDDTIKRMSDNDL